MIIGMISGAIGIGLGLCVGAWLVIKKFMPR